MVNTPLFLPVPTADDIQIGETISFRVDRRMAAFEVIGKGLGVAILRSLDLTVRTEVPFDVFRRQRAILQNIQSEVNPA